MAISTATELRVFGKLPVIAQLPDATITPHLASAGRELACWIGDYSAAAGDKLESCKEAEQCIAMAYLVPVLNTLYTEGTTTLQSELGGMNVRFHDQNDQKMLAEMWMDRARSRVAQYIAAFKNKRAIGWYAV